MNDVIAPKHSSLKPKLVVATLFLKLNMSLIPNNLVDVAEFPILNTLIPSPLELPHGIDDYDDNENEEDDDEEEKDVTSLVPVESEEANHTCWF